MAALIPPCICPILPDMLDSLPCEMFNLSLELFKALLASCKLSVAAIRSSFADASIPILPLACSASVFALSSLSLAIFCSLNS